MKKVFVTGASGLIGEILTDSLIDDGFEVIALIHNSNIKNRSHLTIVQGDITRLDSFEKYLEGVTVIFHLAGVVTDWAPKNIYYDVHVKGTKNILAAAVKYGVKKIVYVSTIDIFAHEEFQLVSEETPHTHSSRPYRKSKLFAHNLVIEEATKGIIQAIIVCPTWVYGPGDKIFVAEIIKQLRMNSFVFVGNKHNFVPLIYTNNLCRLMIDLSKINIQSNYEVFVVSDVNITWEQFITIICNKTGIKYPSISLPYFLSYIVGMMMEFYGYLTHKKERPLLTTTAVETIGRSIKANTRKISDFIQYNPHITFEEGLGKTIDSIISTHIV